MALHISRSGGRPVHRRVQSPRPPSRTPYEIVTDRIVKALEDGVIPWRKPWQENSALPCNAVSYRPYHGVNLFLLGLARYRDHRWLTYRQAEELGGHVRAGEQSSIAVFWKQWEPKDDDNREDSNGRERIPLLRFYHLFNAQQCDGLTLPELEISTRPDHERIEAAEELVRSMPNPPQLHEGAKIACYYPLVDVVQVPPLEAFETPEDYYATLFHELGHATGHESRLNRPGLKSSPRYGPNDYGREELVAELTSAFCCASLGLDNSLIDNAASYINGWLTVIKADPKAVITASGLAQRAADYLQGRCRNEDRSYSDSSADLQEATA